MRAEVLNAAVVAHHQQASVVVISRDKVGDHVVRENTTVPDHTAGLVLHHGYHPRPGMKHQFQSVPLECREVYAPTQRHSLTADRYQTYLSSSPSLALMTLRLGKVLQPLSSTSAQRSSPGLAYAMFHS